jgi:hypothetical protein
MGPQNYEKIIEIQKYFTIKKIMLGFYLRAYPLCFLSKATAFSYPASACITAASPKIIIT